MEFPDLLKVIDSSSNLALCVCTYFIHKAAERLARIEKALQRYMADEEHTK